MNTLCKAFGCSNDTLVGEDFCESCKKYLDSNGLPKLNGMHQVESMADKYPAYYKSVEHLSEVDVYAIHYLFNIQDPSGAIQHASKKLLLSGVRTGGKSMYQDIKEARDTLNRWLELTKQ